MYSYIYTREKEERGAPDKRFSRYLGLAMRPVGDG